jgi:hypothetical protein
MGKSFSEYSAGEIYKLGGVKVALEGICCGVLEWNRREPRKAGNQTTEDRRQRTENSWQRAGS